MDPKRAGSLPVLRKSPLTSVICQLRFPRILGLADDALRGLQVELGEDYPDVQVEEAQQLQVDGVAGLRLGDAERIYRFKTHQGDWTVSFGPTVLSLDTTAYGKFDEFIARWERIARYVVNEFALKHQERLGFRFVNEIPVDGEGADALRRVVREPLIGIIGFHARTQHVIRSLHELRFKQEDGVCTVRHGYAPGDDRGVYVLDFDYYDDEGKPLVLDTQLGQLAAYNHALFDLFQSFVTEEQFAAFEPETSKEAL